MGSAIVVFKKVLRDNINLKLIVCYIALVLIPILFFVNLAEESKMFLNMTASIKTEYLIGFFCIFAFTWICGIAPGMLAIFICSGFIAKEITERTLSLIVSKPIKREHFILAKFFAFLLFSICLQSLALFTSIYVWASFYNLDLYSLSKLLSLVPPLLFYSFFVLLIFSSLSTAFSAIFSSRIKAVLPLIAIVILAFFAFVPIRETVRELGVYESYYLDTLDLGYDLGNIYINTLESCNIKLIPFIQSAIGEFTGTYKIPKHGVRVDYDHGIMLQNLEKTTYHSFEHSLIKWTLIPSLLILLSLVLFGRRDIF